MFRDCGKGILIPVKYSLVWVVGQTGVENSKIIPSLSSKEYDDILGTLPAYSNIRVYAWDKQGYANCIRSDFVDKSGVVVKGTNRIGEL